MVNPKDFVRNFDDVFGETLKRLYDNLEFTPTIFEMRNLADYVRRSLDLYNRDLVQGNFDKPYSITSPSSEAIIRFLCFDCEVIKSFKEYNRITWSDTKRDKFIANLKDNQARDHHWI